MYAADGVAFADFDDDGDEEFVGSSRWGALPPFDWFAAILTFAEHGETIEWRTHEDDGGPYENVLVGNVDDDALDEIVLIEESGHALGGADTLRVVQWNGAKYEETGTRRLSGRLGALLDFDADDIMEVVLTRVERQAESGTGPTTLVVARLRDGGFARIAERALPNGVRAMATGDLDGDGRDEIVTSEKSFDGLVDGQIAVYKAGPDGAIERIFRRNRMIGPTAHLGIIESGGRCYLLVEHSSDLWKSIFRLEGSREAGYELVSARWDSPGLMAAAARSTMAYSAARDAYVRYLHGDKLEFVPAAEAGRPP